MHSRPLSAAVLAVLSIVLPVPGLAQTDSRLHAVLARSSETVARPYLAGTGPSDDGTTLSFNLIVTDIYRSVVQQMLERSPTFRRQCARIAANPQLLVLIESEPPSSVLAPMAMTRISRYEYGRVRAVVRVSVSGRVPELIAHELEHVLEQLDGVDLHVKSRLPASGVHACNCGDTAAFETARAEITGLRVAREIARD
jgi:hypothetical protein